jgi:preprotein translocase subunit YajC
MKHQEPIVRKGTTLEASGHVATVTRITREGVECILEDGSLVTVSREHIEAAT